MNKKGYTIIEIAIVLTLSSMIAYSAFSIPVNVYKGNIEYTKFADSTSDNYHIRKFISKDISSGSIKKLNENTVEIGSHVYEFSDVVKRDSLDITKSKYSFSIEKSTIKVFNDEIEIGYSAKSSLSRGDTNEQ